MTQELRRVRNGLHWEVKIQGVFQVFYNEFATCKIRYVQTIVTA